MSNEGTAPCIKSISFNELWPIFGAYNHSITYFLTLLIYMLVRKLTWFTSINIKNKDIFYLRRFSEFPHCS
jgi:hypothetical protein